MRSGPEAAKDCPSGRASDQVGATTQAAYVVSWNMNMCVYIHEYIHEYIYIDIHIVYIHTTLVFYVYIHTYMYT